MAMTVLSKKITSSFQKFLNINHDKVGSLRHIMLQTDFIEPL